MCFWFSSSSHYIYIHINMKLAIAALLAGSAAAFAPAQTGRVATDLAVSELELGVTEPLGVWDPLKWCETQPESFERRRAVERKHGRVAMAAVIGMLFHNANIEFPGYLSYPGSPLSGPEGLKFSDIPDGFSGLFSIPAFGLVQIFLWVGILETAVWPASNYSGNYGTGYLGQDLSSDPETLKFKLDLEMNQGRAAMLGMFGAMLGEGIQGETLAEHVANGGYIFLPGAF